jgi:hypothetical protein
MHVAHRSKASDDVAEDRACDLWQTSQTMPKKREIDVYEFDELPPKAQKRAIDMYRDAGHMAEETNWALREYFELRLGELGLPIDDIRWRLAYTQGDGVAFYGKFNLEEYLRKHKLKSEFAALSRVAEDISMRIEKVGPHAYDHYNTMQVSGEPQLELSDKQQDELNHVEGLINEDIKKVSRELKRRATTRSNIKRVTKTSLRSFAPITTSSTSTARCCDGHG